MVDVIEYEVCRERFLRELKLGEHYRLVAFPPASKVRELAWECCVEYRDYRSEIRQLSGRLERRPDYHLYRQLRSHLLDAVEQLEDRKMEQAMRSVGAAAESALCALYRRCCVLSPKRAYREGLSLRKLWGSVHGFYEDLSGTQGVNASPEQRRLLQDLEPFVEAMIAIVALRNRASHSGDVGALAGQTSRQDVFYALYILSTMLDRWLPVSESAMED
jgi:hypothetical protein